MVAHGRTPLDRGDNLLGSPVIVLSADNLEAVHDSRNPDVRENGWREENAKADHHQTGNGVILGVSDNEGDRRNEYGD
ncbi:hypothetical protein [Microvirga sesbaniae]|uniref:hypothetical protein n=1 Tax=Microvirga sesbaniae TaxID=681392 RepID=UPI0021C6BDFC|nr:hypothetical protein [Microvirga sp. HBU67692]